MKRWLSRFALYAFHVGFVRPVLYVVIGVRFRRRSLVPDGPCIIVANHNSHLDAAILMSLARLSRLPYVHPVAAADYFGKNAIRRLFAMTFMNAVPIERHPERGQDPLEPIAQRLERGESLIFFPEGSRGEAGVVARFRPGIGRLVKRYPGLLVVPVFMAGPERIWPRGETVPIPVQIEVSVGKPRSYSADLDARAIAESVREDVLAQAPPPAPMPGERAPRPVRVAVCGVEPGVRRDACREVSRALGREGRTLALTEPVLEADSEGLRDASGSLPFVPARWPATILASAFRTGGLFRGYRFADMVYRARLDDALADGRTARFVVGDGNALVDLLAWTEATLRRGPLEDVGPGQWFRYVTRSRPIPLDRWTQFIRHAPEVWLLNVLDLVQPPVPDVVVVLRSLPQRAMTRIRSSGLPVGEHQNERVLGELQKAYATVGEVLRRRGRTRVVEVEADTVAVDEIARRVVRAVLETDVPEAPPGAVAHGAPREEAT